MGAAEIICMANSRKLGGRCIAGLKTDGGGWVRPVSADQGGALLPHQCRVDDGTEARTLDVIRLDLSGPLPQSYQPENWLVSNKMPWRLISRPAPESLIQIICSNLVSGPSLLGNTNDRVPAVSFSGTSAPSSLALVIPNNPRLRVTRDVTSRKQVRAIFEISRTYYDLVVTDPVWERKLSNHPEGDYRLTAAGLKPDDRVLFTVSLGEPFNGYCYKLVAAIILLPESWRNFS